MHSKATDTTIGIDTAVVADHRVAVRGTTPAEDFAVPPTLAGMAMLTRRLAEHAPALAVAEPTGMTWLAIGHAVRAAGCDLTLVQPRHSARLRGAIAGKHKTDVADADMLAGCADVFGLTATTLPSPAQIALRRAVRRRHRAIVDAHRSECRLWALAAWAFPDVWHACQHAQPLLQPLLRCWPHLSQLARARTASIAALCRQRLRRPGDVDRRAERIRDTAAGWADFWQDRLDLDALAWEITELLDDIAAADARIDRAAGHAHQLWRAAWDHDDLLTSLPAVRRDHRAHHPRVVRRRHPVRQRQTGRRVRRPEPIQLGIRPDGRPIETDHQGRTTRAATGVLPGRQRRASPRPAASRVLLAAHGRAVQDPHPGQLRRRPQAHHPGVGDPDQRHTL